MDERIPTSGFAGIVAKTISSHRLLSPGDKVIVALSGGADSVALLSVLDELGYECLAAHCNFHLRGEESNRDMRHTEKVCRHLGIDLTVKDFDVEKRRRDHGGSVEMACRELRYEWFDELLVRNRAKAVAVGHHMEDNIETLLLNLFRGTGIDGLRGIKYRRDDIIRPLLDVSREDIERYLARRGLEFIVDSSNGSDDYLRNRLRNHVIPEIERCFPGASAAMLLTMRNVSGSCAVYDKAVSDYREECSDGDGDIDLRKLTNEAGDCANTVLYEMLRPYGLSAAACDDMLRSADGSGLEFHGRDGFKAELDRGMLHLSHHGEACGQEYYPIDLRRDVLSPVNICISEHDIIEFSPEKNRNVIYFDADAIKSEHRWSLRRWDKGDRIRPYGMTGSKLVSDVFADAKYSSRDKRRAWLLVCDGEPAWIVGLRSSRMFEITPQTRRYLKLEYKP